MRPSKAPVAAETPGPTHWSGVHGSDRPVLMRQVEPPGDYMGEIKDGSAAAKEVGVALAVLYNHIRAGRVTNRKAGGWPLGKGIQVDMDEVRAAVEASKARRSGKAPRAPRGSRKAAHEIHEGLDHEAELRRRSREEKARGSEGNMVRLRRYQRGETFVCPVDPSHGAVYRIEKPTKKGHEFFCSHQAHDGRSPHQLGGACPQTQSYFTREEVSRSDMQVGRLGTIMLEWIYDGRTDLAQDLEEWLVAHELEVWIPERG